MKPNAGAHARAVAHLARRLTHCGAPTPDELSALHELSSGVRSIRRRCDIVSEGRTYEALFLVTDGILIRYRILRDGRRQIVNLAVPGDFAGAPGCFFDGALYSVKAVTEATVSVIPFDRLFGLFESRSRLAAKLFWSLSCEAAIYAENLVSVGRLSAVERVSHFLLELLTRLQVIGLANEGSCDIPLSQEMVADALGLSLPYVNRVLRQLEEDGLATIKGGRLIVHDAAALSDLCDFDSRYLKPRPVADFIGRGSNEIAAAA